MDKNKKLLLGGAIVAVFVGFLLTSGFSSSYGYATPAELESGEKEGELVSVMGNVTSGSVEHYPTNKTLTFTLEKNGASIPVVYEGTVPANFGQGIQVVAKGTYDGEVMRAEKLIVKCPSKYEDGSGPGAG